MTAIPNVNGRYLSASNRSSECAFDFEKKKFLQADTVKVYDELFVSVSTGRHQRLVVSMLVSTFFPDGLLYENWILDVSSVFDQ